MLFDNFSFFSNTLKIYPLANGNGLFLISLAILLLFFIIFLLALVCFKYTTKPILILILLVSSLSNYIMNSYGLVLDEYLIINTLQTNVSEAFDLINIKLFIYLVVLGVIPSYIVYKVKLKEIYSYKRV